MYNLVIKSQSFIGVLGFNISYLIGSCSDLPTNCSVSKFLLRMDCITPEFISRIYGVNNLPSSLRKQERGTVLLARDATIRGPCPGLAPNKSTNDCMPARYDLLVIACATTRDILPYWFSVHSSPISSLASPISAIVDIIRLNGSKLS